MGQRNEELFGVTFEHFDGGPVLAYIRPGRIALRRKRAMWVARAIAASKRWELRRRRGAAAALHAEQSAGRHHAKH
jgi:hypothetical protein